MDMQAILNKKWKLRSNEKGVTLIELLAVVVILGIIAGVAGVAVSGSFTSAKQNADAANVAIITDAVQRYLLEGGSASALIATATTNVATSEDVLEALQTAGYLNTIPKVKVSTTGYFNIVVSGSPSIVTVTVVS
ncbi:prepilin-type N-terminal cleavage/methylation domain-containing protein [Paenibacillus hemerocallicola]|uniref:Prepilin-type N-terminal cleavage/methylation domain-containing protein n=2 Tax=Paenibacillus hemerocallicola TaxID=1172614 RepID=A0A5C4T789_9BACL|nr:prepilin-type N-terminal cleavage/methylation domain-containing protein [Paenibacillus hemerocallicola]